MKIETLKHVVIGLGEKGSALQKVLKCDGEDKFKKEYAEEKRYDIMNVCFPYSETFITEVKSYQERYNPRFTVIHSFVPLGISRECNALHSPIRGTAPNLDIGILTFRKFIGGQNCFEVAQSFKEYGIDCLCTNKQENTEAMSFWDICQEDVLREISKEINNFCDSKGLDFNIVYTLANETHNDGYNKLFKNELVRPFYK